MKIKNFFVFMAVSLCGLSAHALPLTGLYQTIDDATNQPKAIVVLYEYADGDDTELAGRIVATYNADGTIKDVWGAPESQSSKFVGMDIIRGMEWDADDNRYEDGKITDPQSGKVYSSVIWQDVPGKLNVRGKIGPFGRTQVWNVLNGNDVPKDLKNLNTSNWKPQIKK
ncbi:MAG: DUF2147 domain-containing protein [Alphaproteobacteria bacterium]|nr:DUF2147 domain-containing protein [Alphaproteobacteria bacterium]